MEIYKKDYFRIFKANFNYEIVNTDLGEAIKMSPRDAFIYSNITGAGYLENPVYPFTPKGLLKLFYNAFNYKFVSGIFDNGVLKNTPYILSQAKDYLFSGDKYVVPVEFESEKDLISFLKEAFTKTNNLEQYIVQRIETSKQGNGMEPLMEYLAAEYFKNLGFIVENQVPLAHSLGSPDFAGYGLMNMIQKIHKSGFLSGRGFHVIELALIRNFKDFNNDTTEIKNSELLVGEAKTGTSKMSKQLEKYLETGLFDRGFEIHPSKSKPAENYFGLITLNGNFKVTIDSPQNNYISKNPLSKKDYIQWLENYIKFYLIANFTNDELKEFYLDLRGSNLNKESDLVDFVLSIGVEEILERIKQL
jgi:hypothetical protein